ncbi:MAG: AzlD domain-containing protein [Candidatus Rokubacteria bacterium]|nr:AzlD domain-containing protein [Candidatus Rokubacteria bacterium]
MRASVAVVIAGMALVTYLTRAPLLLVLAGRPLPPRLTLWLRLIPLAVLPALAVPLVLAPGGRLVLSPGNPQLWGAVVVFLLAALRVNLLVSVALAVATVALLRAFG